jgi:flagellar transcriptional activator FlhD
MPGREISTGKTGQKKGLIDRSRSDDQTNETEDRHQEPHMTTEQILSEIREANLSYLMLAQSLIRADREQALFRLGVSEDTADILATLSPAQIMKVASGSTLLCQFRMNDDIVWNLLTNHGKVGSAANDGVSRLHASIVMAGRHQEAA